MNKVLLQLWEESNTKEGFLSDGCSLHLNLKERDIFVSSVYKNRDNSIIPNEYDRIVGELSQSNIPVHTRHAIEQQREKMIKQAYDDSLTAKDMLFP